MTETWHLKIYIL